MIFVNDDFSDPADDPADAETQTRRLVALAIACREEGGPDALETILDAHPELAPLIERRLSVLAELGLLDPPVELRFRRT